MKLGFTSLLVGAMLTSFMSSPASAADTRLVLSENRDGTGRSCYYSSSSANLNNSSQCNGIQFGDKASLARNIGTVAWVLYDDTSYNDRAYCIRPGRVVDLHASRDFGDKTSSIKQLSTSSCSGYTEF